MSKDQTVAQGATWWKSEGFFFALVALAATFFVGFPTGEANGIVSALFALIGGAYAIRGKFKDAVPVSWLNWLKNPNTWVGLSGVLAWLAPKLPDGLLQSIQDVFMAIGAKDYQAAIVAAFALLSVIFKRIKG